MRRLMRPALEILCLASLMYAPCLARSPQRFTPPTADEAVRAIGPLDDLSKELRRALDPGDDFQLLPAPGPRDWLAQHEEKGQDFETFRKSRRNVPDRQRNTIYLLPLGGFDAGRTPSLETLRTGTARYFDMPVVMLAPRRTLRPDLTSRTNDLTGKRQFLTRDILAMLAASLPEDAFCMLAITMHDLYPDPKWNYVFGEADLHARVGVFSFARFDPNFCRDERRAGDRSLFLRRSLEVLWHELGHMFGLDHCIYYRCVMNGSNHLAELDASPTHLCPICLRKLVTAIDFKITGRYRGLEAYYRGAGLEEEARWVARRPGVRLPGVTPHPDGGTDPESGTGDVPSALRVRRDGCTSLRDKP